MQNASKNSAPVQDDLNGTTSSRVRCFSFQFLFMILILKVLEVSIAPRQLSRIYG
jgi:hypothetical protein